jgi:hypothetical protein
MFGFKNKDAGQFVQESALEESETTINQTDSEVVAMTNEQDNEKFGLWADSTVNTENGVTKVVIDNSLPDLDRVIIETNESKAAMLISRAVAGVVLASGKNIRFFDGN